MATNEEWKKIVAAVDVSTLTSAVSAASLSISASYAATRLTYELGRFATYYTLDDTFSVDELISRLSSKAVFDTLGVQDQTAFDFFTSFSDGSGITDAVEVAADYIRDTSDFVFSLDAFPELNLELNKDDVLILAESTASFLSKPQLDQVTVADQFRQTVTKQETESVPVEDAFVFTAFYDRLFDETSLVADAIDSFIVAKQLQETANLVDDFTRSVAYDRGTAEMVSTLDTPPVLSFSNLLSETLAVVESLEVTATFHRAFSDVISLEDLPTVSNVVDALGLIDQQAFSLSRGDGESALISDLTSLSIARSPDELVVAQDVSSFGISKANTESVTTVEQFLLVNVYSRAFADAFAVDDTATFGADTGAFKNNVFFLGDDDYFQLNKILSDQFLVSDVFSRVLSVARTADETLSLSESVQIFKQSGGSSVLNGGALNTVSLNN
jgi:hypothetical protein